ncbi:MAG TPA: hydroxymethylbilane synthase [Candidatus Acidoferrales bacterium]|jgi:hydroxymethylbilane synthase|nr:hydroxymethylbilane synthase [Candidatus Acidoferrales bacterium]
MLPISLQPDGRRAVIVGGGNVAARKAESLVGAGFPIFVVAEHIGDRLRRILTESAGVWRERRYESSDLDGAAIVIAATDSLELNAQIVANARAAGALVCDAAQPKRGDFTMPATRRAGELTISVDSGGKSPAFARRVARELSQRLDASYADALHTLGRMRDHVKEAFPSNERAPILQALAERPIAELATTRPTVVCATRRSALAMIQSRAIAARLAERGIATTMLGITTSGDRDQTTPLDRLGAVNVFVKELEGALQERRADYAVHSCKDLASSLPKDLRIAAVSRREDPRDAFCSERYVSFESLPPAAVVGTSSPRRRAQLAALRPDLRYETLRGNVDTRLRKLKDGEYDAIVLAMAGLIRLGHRATHTVPFATATMVPAAGQGALAVETRADDAWLGELIRDAANDPESELCIASERATLRAMRAGCSAPLGVHARIDAGTLVAEGAYADQRGAIARARIERRLSTVEAAEALGTELATCLQAASAAVASGAGN